MKRSLVALAILATALSSALAFADDPLPPEEAPATSAPAPTPPPPAPAPDAPPATTPTTPAPTPSPASPKPAARPDAKSAPKARLSTQQAPRAALGRARVEDDDGRLEKTEDKVEGGRHFRIKTHQGAVHVWFPPGYDRETAGTVVYVHGYYTNSDGAWRDHQLAKQFRQSRQNAMFVVPDAPKGNGESVKWPALKDLRRALVRGNMKLPDGPIVVMGHSGAFRTVMQWVDHRHVDQIILLDAIYGGEQAFDDFIASGKRADEHKLIVVGANTAQESAAFVKKYKFAVAREKVPDSLNGFTKKERRAKLLYIRSQYEHMGIVTSRKVIPILLRVTRLKPL